MVEKDINLLEVQHEVDDVHERGGVGFLHLLR